MHKQYSAKIMLKRTGDSFYLINLKHRSAIDIVIFDSFDEVAEAIEAAKVEYKDDNPSFNVFVQNVTEWEIMSQEFKTN
ncbi:MAG: hypothetical protein IJA32_06430 [Lachnospiraceae bacterium]|nr:hypothetical protein [Lachnospiraceae bacterium]